MARSYYNNEYRPYEPGKSLPIVSTELDSVRTYQFEVHFYGLPLDLLGEQTDLTLAAKQVSPPGGFSVEDIEVNRVNDKMYYPGRPSPEEVTITFDNLYNRRTQETLWEWFKAIYDPITGDMTKNSSPGGSGNASFKATKMEIIQLDNTKTPHASIELYGVYPKAFRPGEHNYSTNDMHTIEVTFRYDFMDVGNIAQ